MMKRLVISLIISAVFLFNLVVASPAQAQPLAALSIPGFQKADLTEQQQGFLEKLEKEVLPQIESVLTPEQRDQFKTSVADGTSLRKAFKSLALTPAQKAKLGSLFKSLPTKDAFASLTPEQKKQLFMKKKDLFMPTPQEIGDKISSKMKMAPDKASGFMPKPETIADKVSEKMKMIKDKAAE